MTGLPAPDPAPPEVRPVAGAAAGERLAGLLDRMTGRFDAELRRELIGEWLATSVARGRLVPPELLPALLDFGRVSRSLRPAIGAAGGNRAAWLAAQRPEWSQVLTALEADPADDPAAWEDGPIGRRAAFLAATRRRDPAAGRALLESSWRQELPDDRAPLLGALRTGLGPTDEEFLERALDDRRAAVRTAAAELLADLPGSRYRSRMTERAHACVRPMAPGRLAVEPPAECDPAMRRDGVALRPPAGVGERAWWLEEVLARTPLAAWTGYAPDPAGFLALPVPDGFAPVLHRGLARAAAAQRAPGWAAALLEVLMPVAAVSGRPEDALLVEALYEALPAQRQTELARQVLAGGVAPIGVDRLLELCPGPWPADLGAAVVAHLDGLFRPRGRPWRAVEIARLAATRLPVDFADAVTALAERLAAQAPQGPHRRAVETLARTLRFRHKMIEELA